MYKTILVTGAFGNIGSFVLAELLQQQFRVKAFDIDTAINRHNAKKFVSSNIDIAWGDITNAEHTSAAMEGVDAVIHLAGIFPPTSENNQALAKAVNIDGTQNILDAMQKHTVKRLVFASSIAVYGKKQGEIPPPLRTDHPVNPGDYYGETKALNETMIQNTDLDWSLLRISACPPVNFKNMASFTGNPMLELHPDSRVEPIHPADTALAFVNAVNNTEAFGKIFLLGGGQQNQITVQALLNDMFATFGLKPMPREAFQISDQIDFHGDWLDTTESQRVLQFQRHTTAKIQDDFKQSLGLIKYTLLPIKLLSPLIYPIMLYTSPYYRKQKQA